MNNRDQAERIQATLNTPGWQDILSIAKEHIAGPRHDLIVMLGVDPENLTGKMAIAKANRAKGVEDFIEEVNDTLKILAQPRKGGQ